MAPEVSGEDILECEGSGKLEAKAPSDGAAHGVPPLAPACLGCSCDVASGARRHRTHSVPSVTLDCRHRPAAADGEEQLHLLWALWEAQQSLLHEDGVIREAAAAHGELLARNDAIWSEILDAEAELREHVPREELPPRRKRDHHRSSCARHSCRPWSTSLEVTGTRRLDVEDSELAELRVQNEALQQSLHRVAEEQVRRSAARLSEVSLLEATNPGATRELDALKAELASLWRVEERRGEEHRNQIDDLHDQVFDVQVRGQEERRLLRDELSEACVQNEVLESELQGAIIGRELTQRQLRLEEESLWRRVQEAAEEKRAFEEARGGALAQLRAGAPCTGGCCAAAEDRLSEASTALGSDTSSPSSTMTSISIWEELQRSRGDQTAENSPQPWGRLTLQGERAQARGGRQSAAARTRRARRQMVSRVPYCNPGLVRPHAAEMQLGLDGEASSSWCPTEQLGVIEEANVQEEDPPTRFPWEEVPKPQAGPPHERTCSGAGTEQAASATCADPAAAPVEPTQPRSLTAAVELQAESSPQPPLGLPPPLPLALVQPAERVPPLSGSRISGNLWSPASGDSSSRTSAMPPCRTSAPTGSASRGVLEWTVREAEAGSPRWAGPCLFEVVTDAAGRLVLQAISLGLAALELPAKDLAIPLLSVTAVREDRQDSLGLVFLVRYKTAGERVEILFRAASRQARAAWVQGLCDVIQKSRRGPATGPAPPPLADS